MSLSTIGKTLNTPLINMLGRVQGREDRCMHLLFHAIVTALLFQISGTLEPIKMNLNAAVLRWSYTMRSMVLSEIFHFSKIAEEHSLHPI